MENILKNKITNYSVVIGEEEVSKPEKIKFFNWKNAIDLINRHITIGNNIVLHCDVDVDGIACGYVMNKFLGDLRSNSIVKPCINREKKHGLTDKAVDYFNKLNIGLVIIMDSGTNDIELIKKIARDVLVIDHHEILKNTRLSGDTDNGRYYIVNNMQDNIEEGYKADSRMSGALVVYELLRQYQDKYATNDILEDRMLYQWVGISLFTDVILTDTLRNQYYVQKTVNNINIEPGLSIMRDNIGYKYGLIDKRFINFKLAPIFNRAIRAEASAEALSIALSNPDGIKELDKYKEMQDKILDRVNYTLKGERDFEDSEKLDIVDRGTYYTCDLSKTDINKSYAGLIATKIMDMKNKDTITGIIDNSIMDGSFRGKYREIDYRGMVEEKGYFSQGHSNAFGLKVDMIGFDSIMSEVDKIEKTIDNKPYITAGFLIDKYKGVYHINDFNDFKRNGYLIRLAIANSRLSGKESIDIVIANDEFEVIKDGGTWKKLSVLGLECLAFEELKTELLTVYVEFSDDLKAFVSNRWN